MEKSNIILKTTRGKTMTKTNEVALRNDFSLATSVEDSTDVLNALSELGQAFRQKICIDAKDFKLASKDNPIIIGKTLNCIILGTSIVPKGKASKKYYAEAYTGNEAELAPTCRSFDGITPDSDVENPICSNCATCKFNAWGSDPASKNRAKACKDFVRLALYLPDQIKDAETEVDDLNIYRFDVPSASLRPLGEYAKLLKRGGKSLVSVVTEIGFDPKQKTTHLTYRAVCETPEALFNIIFKDEVHDLAQSILTDRIISNDNAVWEDEGSEMTEIAPEKVKKVTVKVGAPKPKKVTSSELEEHCTSSGSLDPKAFADDLDDDIEL